MNKKTILFLSALDFKDKSIQVIRKTPEAYADAGWNVHYVVGRDESRHGNYFYENIIECAGVKAYRFKWPLQGLRDRISSRVPLLLLTRLISLLVIFKLAWHGAKILRTTKVDVVYGYEMQGVLAMNVLRLLRLTQDAKKISRFQGVFYIKEMLNAKQYRRIFFNIDTFLALWLSSQLCIMTNDGTQGDKILTKIKSRNLSALKFWVNGVDRHTPETEQVQQIKHALQLAEEPIFISVSRLVPCKGVDKTIKTLSILKNSHNIKKFKCLILGEGQERKNLEDLAKHLGLSENILFMGSVSNSVVKNYLECADYFISTYDSSNVGNPLLEAISANKIIFTLNNGDTGDWISSGINGFIYDIDDTLLTAMAKDMFNVIQDNKLRAKLIEGVKNTAATKLWSWDERLKAEINAVDSLFIQ